MDNVAQIQPKVFCSYSWSTQEYRERIIELSKRLMESGVEVLLDAWDLVEGADIHAYMEKAVTDKSVTHVLIFCDKTYASKADDRSGGVGKETLIITPEVYGQSDVTSKEQKYIPVLMEKDDNGKPCLPAYLSGRYYVDMSSGIQESEEFEKLLRVLYGKPFHKKPQLGSVPTYIWNDDQPRTGLSALKASTISAIRDHKNFAEGRCREYFDKVVQSLDSIIINSNYHNENLHNIIVERIEQTLPLRNECIEVIACIIREFDSEEYGLILHTFFEKAYDYTEFPDDVNQWSEEFSYPIRFFLHEIFLLTCACALSQQRINILRELLDGYYCRSRSAGYKMRPFYQLSRGIRYDNYAFKSSNGEYTESISRGTLLKNRHKNFAGISFEHIMQADLFLFLKSHIMSDRYSQYWFPMTLKCIDYDEAPLELFARAQSKKKCNILLELLGIASLEQFKHMLKHDENLQSLKRMNSFFPLDLWRLCGADDLGTID